MSQQVIVKKQSGIGFFSLLAILFIGLKLTGYINWSWWWVLAPIWGGFAILGVILLVVLLVVLIIVWRVKP